MNAPSQRLPGPKTMHRRRSSRLSSARRGLTALCGVVFLACSAGAPAESPVGAPVAVAQESRGWTPELEMAGARPLPPAGYGTLQQDDITVGLEARSLLIKVVPLTEWVIRLTAPDTYRRLNGYKVRRGDEILERSRRAGEPGWPLVLFVTFYTRALEDEYEPFDLQIRSQNMVFRPLDVLEVTPAFNRERLRQEESQIALYVFPAQIDLDLPLTVLYQTAESDRWSGIRSRLDRELSIVLSRAGAQEQGKN